MVGKGRRKLVSEVTAEEIRGNERLRINALNQAIMAHREGNAPDIRYLVNYKNGSQRILDKEKSIRPEINNKLVLNHAQMITRNIVGYFLGTPIQYIQTGAEKQQEVETLNRMVTYKDKSATDLEIGNYQSICGTAYRIIYTTKDTDAPFAEKSLNPECTFVVYSNNVEETPLFGCYYTTMYDSTGGITGTKYFMYTEDCLYTYVTKNGAVQLTDGSYEALPSQPYMVGGVPIIEYPNNIWRLGDWELCIDLMEAINALESGRLDDIDQIIQSLLVFINAEIDEKQYGEMRASGLVMLKNTTNSPSDVKQLSNLLDQNGMNMFSEELERLLYALIGIPDRNNRSNGGGDTGTAVELRDGWADLEIIARNKELVFKKSEKQALRIILTILSNKAVIKLDMIDVDVKFSRNKNSNLQIKTQAYMNLVATKTLSPADCLTIVDLVSDVNDYISRGQAFWGDTFANKNNDIAQNKPVESNTNNANIPIDK